MSRLFSLGRRLFCVVAPIALFSAVGCQNGLHDDNLNLYNQNQELQVNLDKSQQRVEELTTELGGRPDASQVAQLQGAIQDRDSKIAELQQNLQRQLTTPAPATASTPATDPGIAGIETEFDAKTGEMTVRVPGDVLFDSGVATLKKGAVPTLDKIAAAIKKNYPNKAIRVEGHTDNDPLVHTRSTWTDNRGLSVARALTVARYLEKHGVDAKHLVASGYGEFVPRGNDKAKNRRVEIVVATR